MARSGWLAKRSSLTPLLDMGRHIKHAVLRLPDRLRPQRPGPTNFARRDPASLEADVDYAIQVSTNYMGYLNKAGFILPGSKILELGPGINFGAQLILASHGAQVTLADRFLAPWDDDYHPQFYRMLRARWNGPSGALDAVIGANGYPSQVIALISKGGEQLNSVPARSFDLVLSNAVLEHVQKLKRVASNLARLTKPGGLNLHQIDFGDHWNRPHPLEFLLVNDDEYAKLSRINHWERGNRLRLSQTISVFQAAGFRVDKIENVFSLDDENYFREFVPRLRKSQSSYRNWPEDDLRVLGALLILRK